MTDGKTWREFGTEAFNHNHIGWEAWNRKLISSLAFSPADNRLYAVIQGAGLFWTELPAEK